MASKPYTKIKMPLFNQNIFVYFSLDDFPNPEDFPAGSKACVWEAEGMYAATMVFKEFDLNICAHEALHAVASMHKHVGLPFNLEGQESIAYSLGYLVEELVKHHKKWEQRNEQKAAQTEE